MNPRYDLAAARIALRAAEDGEATLKAILSGQAVGTNDTQRKASTAELLLHSDDYQDALRELRAAQAAVDHAQAAVDHAQAAVDHAQAAVDIANDDLRRAELAARERLAEALLGKRADEAVSDYSYTWGNYNAAHTWGACTCDECRAARRVDDSTWRNGGDF